jgi:hypothetical protein
MDSKEYVLNRGQCQNRSPSRPGIRSVSGCGPYLSFPCGPKTLRNLQEVASIFDVASGPGRLTSKSAPCRFRVLPDDLQAPPYHKIRCDPVPGACARKFMRALPLRVISLYL